ncbi:unnamed protein product, partial [Brassicogethes aeneus]
LLQRTQQNLENSRLNIRDFSYEITPPFAKQNSMANIDVELTTFSNDDNQNNKFNSGDGENLPNSSSHTQDHIDDYSERNKRVHSKHRNDQVYPENSRVYKAYEAKTGPRKNKTRILVDFDGHADEIIDKMKKDENLMGNTPHSQKLQRETLRDMPQCLTVKRCVKRKLSMVKNTKVQKGCCTSLKNKMGNKFHKLKNDLKSVLSALELWYTPLKEIEGRFGSGVGSFFKFLRWIFIFNFILSIPVVLFIVIPQLVYDEPVKNNVTFRFIDIFNGDGYFVKTALYYGFYSNDSVNLSEIDYNMPKAYFFTNISTYLVALVVLCVSSANKYKKSFIETEGGVHNVFAQKIFCSWDFSIANRDAANLKSTSIYNELRELLYDVQKIDVEESFMQKFRTFILQLTSNVLVLFTFAGIAYLIWFCMGKDSAILSAIAVNLVMVFVPYLLSYLVKYEGYKEPRTNLYVTLFRIFLLGFLVISVMTTFWLKKSKTDGARKRRSLRVRHPAPHDAHNLQPEPILAGPFLRAPHIRHGRDKALPHLVRQPGDRAVLLQALEPVLARRPSPDLVHHHGLRQLAVGVLRSRLRYCVRFSVKTIGSVPKLQFYIRNRDHGRF